MWIKKAEYNSLVQASNRERRLSWESIRNEERATNYMKQINDLRLQNDRLCDEMRNLQFGKQQAYCSCGNLLYTMKKTECGCVGWERNDPRAEPSNMENGAMYCVCPKCRRTNKHRFGGLF